MGGGEGGPISNDSKKAFYSSFLYSCWVGAASCNYIYAEEKLGGQGPVYHTYAGGEEKDLREVVVPSVLTRGGRSRFFIQTS